MEKKCSLRYKLKLPLNAIIYIFIYCTHVFCFFEFLFCNSYFIIILIFVIIAHECEMMHCCLPLPVQLGIGSCLACVYRVMDVRGKFGEHAERSVRVARGASSLLSALQTSQMHP